MAISPYIRERALSGFFSQDRLKSYHRINVEYYLNLLNANQEVTNSIIYDGFKTSIEMMGILNDGINAIISEISIQNETLSESKKILSDILDGIKNPRAVEASEKARQAANNMSDACHLGDSDRSGRLFDEAIDLLKQSIEINDYDYKAHFDMGWLCFYYLNDPKKAEYHYDTAVLRSIRKDVGFATFSLRHLAETRIILQDYNGALKAISEACELSNNSNNECLYEFIKILFLNNNDEDANKHFRILIQRNGAYFIAARHDNRLLGNKKFQADLLDIFNKKLQKYIDNLKTIISGYLNDRSGSLVNPHFGCVEASDIGFFKKKIVFGHDECTIPSKQVEMMVSDMEKSFLEALNNIKNIFDADSFLEVIDINNYITILDKEFEKDGNKLSLKKRVEKAKSMISSGGTLDFSNTKISMEFLAFYVASKNSSSIRLEFLPATKTSEYYKSILVKLFNIRNRYICEHLKTLYNKSKKSARYISKELLCFADQFDPYYAGEQNEALISALKEYDINNTRVSINAKRHQ